MSKKPALTLDEIRKWLPDGWVTENWVGQNFLIQSAPRHYVVTVDGAGRVLRSGCTTIGKPINNTTYGGRNWKRALVEAGVAWLNKLEAKDAKH